MASFSCREKGIMVMSFVWVEEPHCTVRDNKCNTFFCVIMHPPNTTRGFLRAFYSLDCNSNMFIILQSDYPNMFHGSIYFLGCFQRRTEPLSTDLQCFLFLLVDKFSQRFQLENFQILRIFHSRTQDQKCQKQHTFTIGSSR